MTEVKLDKKSLIVACGGGTLTDLVGFAAASFQRGLPLVLIPTTLLGMVDAAIGGKNGINLLGLKNQIGTIYFPKLVIVNFNFLKSLSIRQLKEGMAEIIKYAIIADEELFSFLESQPFPYQDIFVWEKIIRKCISIKQQFVESSKIDPEVRDLLNFGHTFGHAIESITHHTISHGEAVIMGMKLALELSNRLGRIKTDELERIFKLLEKLELNRPLPNFEIEKFIDLMRCDKKGSFEKINLILADKIGKVFKAHDIPEYLIKEVLDAKKIAYNC